MLFFHEFTNVCTLISDLVWDFEEVGDSMLHYVNTSLEYGAAKMWCQGLGAQLVEFWTEQEYQDVSAYLSNFYHKPSLSHK